MSKASLSPKLALHYYCELFVSLPSLCDTRISFTFLPPRLVLNAFYLSIFPISQSTWDSSPLVRRCHLSLPYIPSLVACPAVTFPLRPIASSEGYAAGLTLPPLTGFHRPPIDRPRVSSWIFQRPIQLGPVPATITCPHLRLSQPPFAALGRYVWSVFIRSWPQHEQFLIDYQCGCGTRDYVVVNTFSIQFADLWFAVATELYLTSSPPADVTYRLVHLAQPHTSQTSSDPFPPLTSIASLHTACPVAHSAGVSPLPHSSNRIPRYSAFPKSRQIQRQLRLF